ncbi:MAG: DNA-3-methyladenine glycosylase I [Anaerococcus sp.]|nr:DNA-3-methyladenine glycosylase I [Anaerococcus sp.]
MKKRCEWVKSDLSKAYHDEEYGLRKIDDAYLFEILVLEFMQAGLSFEIVLKKREAMRKAFDNFSYEKISLYDDEKIESFMENKLLIRNAKKLRALVANAKAFIRVIEEFGSFDKYLRNFIKDPIDYKRNEKETICQSPLSKSLARDLKKRDFKFIGPITIHSYLEAIGLINNHSLECFRHDEVNKINKTLN